MKNTSTPAEAQKASTWIERFALPLTVSAMEAQPIALVIALLTVLVAGPKATPPIGAGEIALVALGLLWWAMIVEHIARSKSIGKQAIWLYILGWLLAFIVVVGLYLLSLGKLENIFAVLLGTVLVTWLWRRSMRRAQLGFEYAELATSFKVGFGVLLGILFIAIVLPELQTLRDALADALPIFFLSGLVMLSLVRLGTIRNTHRALDGSMQADPTRSWLLALALFGVTLIVIVLVIESLFSFASFELVLSALTPVWNALGTLVGWIVYGIVFLLSPLFYLISFLIGLLKGHVSSKPQQQDTGPPKSPFLQPWSAQSIPPEVLAIGRWVFLGLILIVALLVVRASLQRWRKLSDDEGVEEIREGLDARSLLSDRWREWWNRRRSRKSTTVLPEPLDPGSARAHYRELLQVVATSNGELARTAAETPLEYEERLLLYLDSGKVHSQQLSKSDDEATETAMLGELTHAYTRERYGGKHTDDRQCARLRTLIPRLIARLTGRASTRASMHRLPTYYDKKRYGGEFSNQGERDHRRQ
jgi:hypothetical protein